MNTDKLKHIAPTLAKLLEEKTPTGFKTPEAYFTHFDDVVIKAIQKPSLPEKTGFKTPKSYFEHMEQQFFDSLESLEKPLTVPDNYFDSIEDQVFARLDIEKETKVVSLKKYWISGLVAVAASLLLYFNIFTSKQTDSIDTAAIESYILDGEIDVDTYELAEAISTNDIISLEEQNTIEQDDIESYLLESVSEENLY